MSWYSKHARELPWRETRDSYKIWISEIMLQQTTVNAVIPYYRKWIKKYPTVNHLVRESEQNLLKAWQGLGYYTRVRNIKKAAHVLVEQFDGKIPKDSHQLRKIPGFGPYTVGAVLSIAYDLRVPIVDANVRRVFMRLLAIEGLADVSKDKDIYSLLEKIMPQKNNYIFNQSLMELGALICRNREPVCVMCPVKGMCKAYQKGVQEIIPQTKKKEIKNLDVSLAVIKRANKYLIQQRPSKGLLADLWEFPGGKIEKSETAISALKREIKEELGVDVKSSRLFMKAVHYYTSFRVKLNVFDCSVKSYPANNLKRKWVSAKDFSKYPMPSGSAKIVERLSSVK